MRRQVLLDTGPLVALLRSNDPFHNWTKAELATIENPLLTCEAVVAEACFLLRTIHSGSEKVLSLLERDIIQVGFHLDETASSVKELMIRYQSVPMSLADACLVRMAELNFNSPILTFDSDFRIYRKNKNQTIPTIMPEFQS